jgi:2-dehydropantoate 2-reductase
LYLEIEMASVYGSQPRIVVLGCGGLGGVIAANLTARGQRVHAVARRREVVDSIARRGFELRGVGGTRHIPGEAHLGIPAEDGPFDIAILATQPNQVEGAAIELKPHLSAEATVVCLQNGLCESRVARALGDPARVYGAVVTWGASAPAPGVFERTSRGGFVVGALEPSLGREDRKLAQLTALLSAVGPTTPTDNLTGVRWSKLAVNCAISSLGTIAGERLGPLVRLRPVRRLALEIITEVVAVAKAEQIRLEPLLGALHLPRLALTEREQTSRGRASLAAKHGLLLAMGLRYRRLRSSMLAAIERGHAPPVEYLNGEVASRARRRAIPTPVNDAVIDAIQRIGRSESAPQRSSLLGLYRQTRLTRANSGHLCRPESANQAGAAQTHSATKD